MKQIKKQGARCVLGGDGTILKNKNNMENKSFVNGVVEGTRDSLKRKNQDELLGK